MVSGIYFIRCLTNGGRYVGSSRNVKQRTSAHRSQLRSGVHSNPRLQNCFNLYGEGSFSFEFIEPVAVEYLFAVEQTYLDWNFRQEVCLNLARETGAPARGTRLSEQTKAKLSAALLGLVRGPPTAEHRKNISLAKMGHGVTEETKEKIRTKLRGRVFTPEWRAKLCAAARRRKRV